MNNLPRLQRVIAYPLFPTLTGQLIFLIVPTSISIGSGNVPYLAQSRDASPLRWFGEGLSGTSEMRSEYDPRMGAGYAPP